MKAQEVILQVLEKGHAKHKDFNRPLIAAGYPLKKYKGITLAQLKTAGLISYNAKKGVWYKRETSALEPKPKPKRRKRRRGLWHVEIRVTGKVQKVKVKAVDLRFLANGTVTVVGSGLSMSFFSSDVRVGRI